MKGITVTLTAANVAYNLMDLLVAIDPTVFRGYREVQIQSDWNNGGSFVYIGDPGMSGLRLGCSLKAGEYRVFRDDKPSVDPRHFTLMTDGVSILVNVLLLEL